MGKTTVWVKFKSKTSRCGRAAMPTNSKKFLRYNENVRSRISPRERGRKSRSAISLPVRGSQRSGRLHSIKSTLKRRPQLAASYETDACSATVVATTSAQQNPTLREFSSSVQIPHAHSKVLRGYDFVANRVVNQFRSEERRVGKEGRVRWW